MERRKDKKGEKRGVDEKRKGRENVRGKKGKPRKELGRGKEGIKMLERMKIEKITRKDQGKRKNGEEKVENLREGKGVEKMVREEGEGRERGRGAIRLG